MRPERCGWMSAGAAGPRRCCRRRGSISTICRDWSKAAKSARCSLPSSRGVGAWHPAWWLPAAPESELLAPLGEIVERPSPVQFLPYLDGERTPHNDATAAGAFVGLRSATGRDDVVQAVLEGVAFAARDNLAALGGSSPAIAELDLVGGGSRSALWAQIIADVLGIPVHRVEEGEVGAALGAARLGRLAATGEEPTKVCTRPRRLASFAPRASAVAGYDEAYHQWQKLYPALKELSA